MSALAVVEHRRDELANRDPDLCPLEACERCSRRCSCPPCRCPRCLERPALLRARHDGRTPAAAQPDPTDLELLAIADELVLFDL